MAEDESFIRRWARRKAEQETPHDEEAPKATMESAAPPAIRETEDEPAIDLDSLPDIESLDVTSDFSVFMQKGVPNALRTRALQKLWRLDPSFGHIDGLLEYADDFTDSNVAVEAVRTIYQVGKGMLREEDRETSEEEVRPTPESVSDAEEAAPAAKPIAGPDERRDTQADTTDADSPARRGDPDQTG